MDLRRIIGGECAVGVEAASVGFVDKTNFAPQRYELILKRQRKCEFFYFLFVIYAAGGLTRGKTLHEAGYRCYEGICYSSGEGSAAMGISSSESGRR